jgi:peroxiredoxin
MHGTFFYKYGLFIGIFLVLATGWMMYGMRNTMVLERLESTVNTRFQVINKYTKTQYLPDVKFAGPKGTILSLKDFEGKHLILNIWATWCSPCIEELPRLQNLQQHYLGKDWNVIAVSIDSRKDIEKLIAFIDRYQLGRVAQYHDIQADLQKSLPLEKLPVTYIINKRGRIHYQIYGSAVWDAPDIIEFLDYVAKVK